MTGPGVEFMHSIENFRPPDAYGVRLEPASPRPEIRADSVTGQRHFPGKCLRVHQNPLSNGALVSFPHIFVWLLLRFV